MPPPSPVGTANIFFDADENSFLECLESCSKFPCFVPLGEGTSKFVYIQPLWLNNASDSMLYVLFLISPSSLTDFLQSEIPNGVEISALSYGDTLLFGEFLSEDRMEGQENLLVKSAPSANGLRVQLSMDRTIIQQNLENIKLHALLIAAINSVQSLIRICRTLVSGTPPVQMPPMCASNPGVHCHEDPASRSLSPAGRISSTWHTERPTKIPGRSLSARYADRKGVRP